MLAKFWIALILALVLNASANLLLKAGMNDVHAAGGLLKDGPVAAVVTILTSYKLLIGMICFGLNFLCFMYALQQIPISVGYPIMTSVGFVLILFVAAWQLHERLTSWQWVGAAMIIVGVWLVAWNADRQLPDEKGPADIVAGSDESTSS